MNQALGRRGQGHAIVTLDQQAGLAQAREGFAQLRLIRNVALDQVDGGHDFKQFGRAALGGEGRGKQDEGIVIVNRIHG